MTGTLFTNGVNALLAIENQEELKEKPATLTPYEDHILDLIVKDKVDYKGPYGVYYREIFFHIPFLIANHLNSQGKYAEAQKWYHYIFDPSGLSRRENWQFLEFRNSGLDSLRDQLYDSQVIEAYKKDPFNPHAIARLRTSAYQKTIVMKYIDNLLDWGDQLFARDTMESINEASLLYIVAREILGNRPPEIGDCGEGEIQPKNYETIAAHLDQDTDFFAEMEHYVYGWRPQRPRGSENDFMMEYSTIYQYANKVAGEVNHSRETNYEAAPVVGKTLHQRKETKHYYEEDETIMQVRPVDAAAGAFGAGITKALDWKEEFTYGKKGQNEETISFGQSLVQQVSPVFCVPGNKHLLDYYDRVDDRLYKIRNCLNIKGQRRQLALFAPEIDPGLLVRAAAAGLSLDDVLSAGSGNLPPYRFAYLLEKAKAFTAVVQSYGASLLSAIEKKSGEELALLRLGHQKNILKMASKSRELEIESANETIKAVLERKASLHYQIGYFDALIEERINGWETLQSVGRHTASIIRGAEAAISLVAGLIYLIPDVGSPFAMVYGGKKIGDSLAEFAFAMTSLANLGENISISAGLEAGFERRKQGWEHQREKLDYELQEIEKKLLAAEIRRDILLEAEKIHQKTIDHNNEVMDFYGEKFSNLGLYTWLSTTMQRLFRQAFNNALAIAQLAEQAYHFERDDKTIFIEGNFFESSRAGLLAGERLLMALQNMERRFLETNYRKNEIDQAFSLTQLNPQALLVLKQTGSCEFTIPEIFFDLFYPGQYKRKIKSVRLTIPSVTGPYTNVSATLSIKSSEIRMKPKLDSELTKVPNGRTMTIATSTAQNDAGVFQLNFRDERYMPFEGAGAVNSVWKLQLPKNFRQFDYNTINDVIIHVSYTADYDELFREKVEAQNEELEGTLSNVLKKESLFRTFSFRQEFSTDFHRLTEQSVNSPVVIKIEPKHFPFFLNGKPLDVVSSKLILITAMGQTVNNFEIKINEKTISGFTPDKNLGDLLAKDLEKLFNGDVISEHTFVISAGGELAPVDQGIGPIPAIDKEKLEDLVLLVEYRLASEQTGEIN